MQATQTIKRTLPATLWGEMGHDQIFLVPGPGLTIQKAQITGLARDPTNQDALVGEARYKLEKESPNKIVVNWWHNASFELKYELTVHYTHTAGSPILVKSQRVYAPLVRREQGLKTVLLSGSGQEYYPKHFSVEFPATAKIESVVLLSGDMGIDHTFELTIAGQTALFAGNQRSLAHAGKSVFSPWHLKCTSGTPPPEFGAVVEWAIN
jgi:hypothetical protein